MSESRSPSSSPSATSRTTYGWDGAWYFQVCRGQVMANGQSLSNGNVVALSREPENPIPEMCLILHRSSDPTATLSLTCGGKLQMFTLSKAKLHRLLETGHKALAEMEENR